MPRCVLETDTRRSRWITGILILLLAVWRLPFLNRGIDYTDTGFSMVNYKNAVFGQGINGIGVFLTTWLGGVIWKLLPAYHLLVYRALHWLLSLATELAAFAYFKKYMPRNLLLLGLLIYQLAEKGGEMIFSYYPLTKLLLMLAIIFLLRGLTEKKAGLLVVSGILCGVNCYVRLPNVLFCGMVLGIAWYMSARKQPHWLRACLLYCLGVFIGLAVLFPLLLHSLGWDKLFENFYGYIELAIGSTGSAINPIGITESSGHSMLAVFETLARQGYRTITVVLLYFVPTYLVSWLLWVVLHRLVPGCGKEKLQTILFAVTSVAVTVLLRNRIDRVWSYIAVLYALLLSVGLAWRVRRQNPEISTIFFLYVVLGVFCLFGSDLGFQRLMMLAGLVPVVIYLGIEQLGESEQPLISVGKLKMSLRFCRRAGYCLMLCGIVVAACFSLRMTYMDAPFEQLTASVKPEIVQLRGMKTSPKRARQIEEYYDLMQSEELCGKEVAVFGWFPLGFAFTDTTNYFETVQPCVDYPSVSVRSLAAEIAKKEAEGSVPVIVVSHINRLYRNEKTDTGAAKTAVMEYMLLLHDYEIYSDTENFTVYVAEK